MVQRFFTILGGIGKLADYLDTDSNFCQVSYTNPVLCCKESICVYIPFGYSNLSQYFFMKCTKIYLAVKCFSNDEFRKFCVQLSSIVVKATGGIFFV